MKRVMILGFLVMAISAVAYIAVADEVYWDFSIPDDAVTDKDFSHDYGVPLQSQGEAEVYDQFQVPDVESRSEQAPIQVRPSDTPTRVVPSVQPAETSRPSRTITPRQPETFRKPATVTTPKPAETDPGTVTSDVGLPEKGVGAQDLGADLKKASPAPETDSQRPTTRRMRWGQVDVKPSEPKPQSDQTPHAVE
jgi:hypothetical protein